MAKLKNKPPRAILANPTLWKQLGGLFVVWRLGLLVLAALANWFLPYRPSFPYADAMLLNRGLPQWLVSWANFDGVHYLTIIEKGYLGTGLIQAFFPLYPGLVWLVSLTGLDPVIVGFVLSNIFWLLLLALLYSYLAETINPKTAWWSCVALALFPTAFFLGATYTESLFLLLVLGSLWAGQQQRWALAALAAALASATRLVGIFLVPALLLELVQTYLSRTTTTKLATNWWRPSFWLAFIKQEARAIGTILLGSLGLLVYMSYLGKTFDDPLYFYHVQSEFGSGRQESIVLLPQVFWRYLKILITYRPFDWKYFAFVQELVTTIVAYAAVLVASRKVRWSCTLFALLALTLPTLTGTLSSMPRYALAALPMFVLAGHYLATGSKWWRFWLAISTLLLSINTLLFIQGYWVA